MNKQERVTLAGIVAAVMIAVGGLYLTSTLLAQQEERLLDATEQITVSEELLSDDSEPEYKDIEVADLRLAIDFFHISWSSGLHEPREGQLNMQQAVAVAKDLMKTFAEAGIIEASWIADEYNMTSAMLYNPYYSDYYKVQEGDAAIDMLEYRIEDEDSEWADIMLSYWDVELSDGNFRAWFRIHAQSGLIWNAGFEDNSENEFETALDCRQILNVYLEHIGLSEYYKTRDFANYDYGFVAGYSDELLAAYVNTRAESISFYNTLEEFVDAWQQMAAEWIEQPYGDEVEADWLEWQRSSGLIEVGLMPEYMGY